MMERDKHMGTREAAQAIIDALESHNFEILPGLVTDDFVFDNGRGMRLSVQQWMGMLQRVAEAAPDLAFNLEILDVTGDRARVRNQFAGTHTGTLDLTAMGMGLYPATNQVMQAAAEEAMSVVRDDKLASITVFPTEGSGIASLMAQMGVQFP
jgi:predicted ester cyclase